MTDPLDRWEIMMRLADTLDCLKARHLGGAMYGLERLIIDLAQEEALQVRADFLERGMPPHVFNQ